MLVPSSRPRDSNPTRRTPRFHGSTNSLDAFCELCANTYHRSLQSEPGPSPSHLRHNEVTILHGKAKDALQSCKKQSDTKFLRRKGLLKAAKGIYDVMHPKRESPPLNGIISLIKAAMSIEKPCRGTFGNLCTLIEDGERLIADLALVAEYAHKLKIPESKVDALRQMETLLALHRGFGDDERTDFRRELIGRNRRYLYGTLQRLFEEKINALETDPTHPAPRPAIWEVLKKEDAVPKLSPDFVEILQGINAHDLKKLINPSDIGNQHKNNSHTQGNETESPDTVIKEETEDLFPKLRTEAEERHKTQPIPGYKSNIEAKRHAPKYIETPWHEASVNVFLSKAAGEITLYLERALTLLEDPKVEWGSTLRDQFNTFCGTLGSMRDECLDIVDSIKLAKILCDEAIQSVSYSGAEPTPNVPDAATVPPLEESHGTGNNQ